MKFGPVKIMLLAAAVALATESAQAQGVGGGRKQHQQKADTTQAPKAKVDDKAYAAALKSLPNKQFDPWHGVR